MENYNIVPSHLAVKAMRDSGYKNTAYALAELIDNAIQADAKTVKVLCEEKTNYSQNRNTDVISEIGVLDDGKGMSKNILRMALQFGNGTRLNPAEQTGIGKFGMGLPASSISQARKVEVWSWQSGLESAYYTYLDIDEINDGKITEVPEPINKQIPKKWLESGKDFYQKGTLVVWSKIDKSIWKTANTLLKHTESIIGRIYRRFINDGRCKIMLCSFHESSPYDVKERVAFPNDPMYLMERTTCPAPFNDKPMFTKWGSDFKITVHHGGEEHLVTVRFSYAKEEARIGDNPGAKPHGKHAANNLGVSIIRADREIELDTSWTNHHDPTERWWGCEVEFPPALDDVFGLTNNKQSVRNFSQLSADNFANLTKEEIENLKNENDPTALLLDISQKISSNLSQIRSLLKKQKIGGRSIAKRRHISPNSPEAIATFATLKRKSEGILGKSDKEEGKPLIERKQDVYNTLKDIGMIDSYAKDLTETTFESNLKYIFTYTELDSSSFFSVRPKGGELLILLNSKHPVYDNLIQILDNEDNDLNESENNVNELNDKLTKARTGLRLLLAAWARYEDEQNDEEQLEKLQDIRNDWGKILRSFFKYDS